MELLPDLWKLHTLLQAVHCQYCAEAFFGTACSGPAQQQTCLVIAQQSRLLVHWTKGLRFYTFASMQAAVGIVFLYLHSFTMHLHDSVHRDTVGMLAVQIARLQCSDVVQCHLGLCNHGLR